MLYDANTMNELASTLKDYYGQLQMSSSDLQDASKQLQAAWTNENTGQSNSAWTAFAAVKGKWDNEFGDTMTTLNRVAAEVENALGRALGADQKIGDGFTS
ncbi:MULTISPECIES: hypothetical protein [unclassified Nocardia]|uniref:hypothetical protein n=1 Tax=unclassified Nocardia TaxID=2637762 RepID=UPI002E11A847|nr:hypothetical protein OG326_06820 [Nocardia sp. NBC_01327]